MSYTAIFNDYWAITESGLDIIKSALDRKSSMEALLDKRGERPINTELTEIRDNKAIIRIIGPVFHYQNILTEIFGFPAAEKVLQEVQSSLENSQVEQIVLQIDSPGGQVGGMNELASFIRDKANKPIISYVSNQAASAGYWIASAADKVIVDKTAQLGSIGIVAKLQKKNDNNIEIVNSASPAKRLDPGSKEGQDQIQKQLDDLAEVFIKSIMRFRNLSREQVTSTKGGLLVGEKAISAGLADQTGSLVQIINGGQEMLAKKGTSPGNKAQAKTQDKPKMSNEQFKVAKDIVADAGSAVENKANPNDFESLVASYQEKQGCSRGEAIKAMMDAYPSAYENWLDSHQDSGNQGVQAHEHNFWQAAQKMSAEQDISMGQAMKELASQNPQLHQNFLQEVNR